MHQAACQSAPASKPATDRSSSSSGQCNDDPPPPISHFVRCSGVAARNNGNQMSGTLMSRPSVSDTCIISSSKFTVLAAPFLAQRLFEICSYSPEILECVGKRSPKPLWIKVDDLEGAWH